MSVRKCVCLIINTFKFSGSTLVRDLWSSPWLKHSTTIRFLRAWCGSQSEPPVDYSLLGFFLYHTLRLVYRLYNTITIKAWGTRDPIWIMEYWFYCSTLWSSHAEILVSHLLFRGGVLNVEFGTPVRTPPIKFTSGLFCVWCPIFLCESLQTTTVIGE